MAHPLSTRLNQMLLGLVFFLLASSHALAGTIVVTSRVSGGICEFEVTMGDNAPNSKIQKFGNVPAGSWAKFETSKFCYRRSINGRACGLGLTEWKCCEAKGDGETNCFVQ